MTAVADHATLWHVMSETHTTYQTQTQETETMTTSTATRTHYVIILDGIHDPRSEAYCQAYESHLDEIAPEHDWTVREAFRGEIPGTHYRTRHGSLQILGCSIPVPDDVRDATNAAWMHAEESEEVRS